MSIHKYYLKYCFYVNNEDQGEVQIQDIYSFKYSIYTLFFSLIHCQPDLKFYVPTLTRNNIAKQSVYLKFLVWLIVDKYKINS